MRSGPVVLAAAIVALASAGGASAHAYLVKTDPSNGAVVKASPAHVTLVYDEGVSTTPGALGVYDSAGRRIDAGQVLRPAGDAVAVAISQRLRRGTYTVSWRVTSADTHVVHGAFTFSVGAPGNAGGIAAKLLKQQQTPASLSLLFTAVRFANFLLILACGGGAVALAVVLRGADAKVRRRLAGLLAVLAGLLVLVAAAGLPFEAAEANGSELGGGFSVAAIAEVRKLRFGQVWLFRAWIAAAIAVLALSLEHWRTRWLPVREAALVALGVLVVLTPSAAGHADIAGPFTFAADAAHVAAAAVWTGGLAFTVVALVASPARERWELAGRIVPRFSALAVGAVALLLVAV